MTWTYWSKDLQIWMTFTLYIYRHQHNIIHFVTLAWCTWTSRRLASFMKFTVNSITPRGPRKRARMSTNNFWSSTVAWPKITRNQYTSQFFLWTVYFVQSIPNVSITRQLARILLRHCVASPRCTASSAFRAVIAGAFFLANWKVRVVRLKQDVLTLTWRKSEDI
jgi:hypothetical protein